MDEREDPAASFDPRTWTAKSGGENHASAGLERRRRFARGNEGPRILLAAFAAAAIVAVGAVAAYLGRDDNMRIAAEQAPANLDGAAETQP